VLRTGWISFKKKLTIRWIKFDSHGNRSDFLKSSFVFLLAFVMLCFHHLFFFSNLSSSPTNLNEIFQTEFFFAPFLVIFYGV